MAFRGAKGKGGAKGKARWTMDVFAWFITGNRISTPSNKDICSIYGSHSQAVHCNHRFSSWEITLREAGKAPGSTKPKDDDEIEVAMAIGKVFHWKSTWVEI